jgi:hypothetical protein
MRFVIGAIEGEVTQRLELASIRFNHDEYVGVYASSTLFAAAHTLTRLSFFVDKCGLKLSSTIAIRTSIGCRLRR